MSDDVIRRGLCWYISDTPRGLELAKKAAASTITAEEIVTALGSLGVWWGIESQYGGDGAYESHAYSGFGTPVVEALEDMKEETAEGLRGTGLHGSTEIENWFGGDVAVILTAKRPKFLWGPDNVATPWDPAVMNPASGMDGNSYLPADTRLEIIEVRYDAGNGWRTLRANGIRTTAMPVAPTPDLRFEVYKGKRKTGRQSPGITWLYAFNTDGDVGVGLMGWHHDQQLGPMGWRRGEIYSIDVNEQWRRRGIATAMLAKAREIEPRVHHSHALSEDGKAWSQVAASKTAASDVKIVTSVLTSSAPASWGGPLENLFVRAQIEGKNVGSLTVARFAGRPDQQHLGPDGDYLYVSGLKVDREHQRKGIATQMWEAVHSHYPTTPVIHGGNLPTEQSSDAKALTVTLKRRWPNLHFGSKVALPSWRDRGIMPERAEAIIAPDLGRARSNSYEVFLYGQPHARRPSLAEAKETVEAIYGTLDWIKVPGDADPHPDRIWGETAMFNDAPYYLVVDRLPRLGATASTPFRMWHGSPSGDLRGGAYGLHVGTQEAARQALEARIGMRADGKDWDGTQEYGKTLLMGKTNIRKKDPYRVTGYNSDCPDEDHYPTGTAGYGDGNTKVPMTARPDLFEVEVVGPMSNTPETPHEDFKANGYMRGAITRGNAKRGYFYTNVGEDEGSVSAVLPGPGHVRRTGRHAVRQTTAIKDRPSPDPVEYRHTPPRPSPLDDSGVPTGGHHQISARLGGREIGYLIWWDPQEGPYKDSVNFGPKVDKVEVATAHRRQGLAAEMFRRAKEITPRLKHSDKLTGDGRAWRDGTSPSEAGTPAYPKSMSPRLGTQQPMQYTVRVEFGRRRSGVEESPEGPMTPAYLNADAGERYVTVWAHSETEARVLASEMVAAGDDSARNPIGQTGDMPTRAEVVKVATDEHWRPTKGMFARGQDILDPRIFDPDTEQMLPGVRTSVIFALDMYWTPLYGDWRSWAKVFLCGSGASYWWDSDADFDVLIGVDLDRLREARPANREVSDEDILGTLNRGLREDLRPLTTDLNGFETTWFCNADSYDVTKIHPYAAYDMTSDGWVVKPPVLPANWGPSSIPEETWRRCEMAALNAKEALELPEPERTIAGTVYFDWVHEGRRAAYSAYGGGWLDPGNVIYQYLTQHPESLLRRLYLCKHPEQATEAEAIEKTAASGSLPPGYTMRVDEEITERWGLPKVWVHVEYEGKEVGSLSVHQRRFEGDPGPVGHPNVFVSPEHQRKGIATAMYAEVKKRWPDVPIVHSEHASDEAKALNRTLAASTASKTARIAPLPFAGFDGPLARRFDSYDAQSQRDIRNAVRALEEGTLAEPPDPKKGPLTGFHTIPAGALSESSTPDRVLVQRTPQGWKAVYYIPHHNYDGAERDIAGWQRAMSRSAARPPLRGGTIYRGLRSDLADVEEQVRDLVFSPELDEESYREWGPHGGKKVQAGELIVRSLEKSHWDSEMGLGRHWSERREMAEIGALQGGRGNYGILLTGTYDPADVDPDWDSDAPFMEAESEVRLKPGAQVEITKVEIRGLGGGYETVSYKPIRATADYNMAYYAIDWAWQNYLDRQAGGRGQHDLTKTRTMPLLERLARTILDDHGFSDTEVTLARALPGESEAEGEIGHVTLNIGNDMRNKWTVIHEMVHALDLAAGNDEGMYFDNHGEAFKRVFASLLRKYGGVEVDLSRRP